MQSSRLSHALLLSIFLFCVRSPTSARCVATTAGGSRHRVSADDPELLYTSGGVAVPLSLVREHVSSVPRHVLPDLLFEHSVGGHLVSRNVRLNVEDIAPRVHVPDVSSTRVVVDNVRRRVAPRGPTMRFGDNHTFVYDYQSNVLLAAWGPGLHLRPLHLERHPNILVNIRHGSSLKRLHLPQVPFPVNHQKSNPTKASTSLSSHLLNSEEKHYLPHERVAQTNYRPRFSSESEIFFDVAFAFDVTFCKRYTSNPDNVTQVVHAAGVAAHKMAFGPIVSVRIGDIIGSCNDTDDPFRRPASVFNCPSNSRQCSRPGLILQAFRKAWPGGGVADATYLLSGYEEGSDVVGAAWVAAACNPKYAFGWVEGEFPVIIAHEIAHTLGATHDSTGLMRPILDLNKTDTLSGKSLNQIQSYLRKISSFNCLRPRHGSTAQNRRRYSAFTRITLSNITEGTDVAVLSLSSNALVAEVVMLDVRRTLRFGENPVFSFATVRRFPNNKGFPFSVQNDVLPNFFRAKYLPRWHPAGAGVAISKIIDGIHNDIVIVFLTRGFPRYVVGHKVDTKRGVLGNWMQVPRVPRYIGFTIQCIGATIGDLSGNGTKDMVIAYVDLKGETYRPYYIVGFDIGANGKAQRWTNPQSLQWESKDEIGDIGVELIDTTRSGRPDLVISHTERINGLWAYRITVGYDLKLTGLPSRPWESVSPDLTYSSTSEVEKITGGIAMADMGSNRPTAIIYQSRQISSGNTQWVEVGDDILAEEPGDAPPIISVVDGVTPLETCSECYSESAGLPQCLERIRQCFANRAPPDISTLSGKQQWASEVAKRSHVPELNTRIAQALKPSTPSIFCAGFHQLFLASQKGCRTDVQPVDIVSVGAASALQDDIDSIEEDALDIEVFNTTFGKVPEYLRYLVPGGTSGNTKVPKTVEIFFRSGKPSRQQVIQKALQRFKKRRDFQSLFSRATFKVVKKNNRKYVVFIKFNDKYLKGFLRRLSSSS